MSRLVETFTGIAVFIACIGLFGLSSYRTERRTKEIGIRKAVGAERWQIVQLIGGEFAKVILFAAVIAWPIAHFLTHTWLEGFAYRTDVSMWLYPGVGSGVLVLGLLTVTYHSLRLASVDPSRTLRDE